LFLEQHYNPIFKQNGIVVRWLYNDALRSSALKEMKIEGEVGGSKLDIALYGTIAGKLIIFGGIHAKLSLAERVSDDVPCSVAMMKRGLSSYLITLDAKSFPPPNGDLVNRGELGTLENPSDKRAYIESHGSFTACFSYNLRTAPSGLKTSSGRRIYSSTFSLKKDPLPGVVLSAWQTFVEFHK
jgi:BsaWI restriction endonuclease type 2